MNSEEQSKDKKNSKLSTAILARRSPVLETSCKEAFHLPVPSLPKYREKKF